jgi:predicted transcriptional regulator
MINVSVLFMKSESITLLFCSLKRKEILHVFLKKHNKTAAIF